MPCWTIQTTSVELKVDNIVFLMAALKQLGYIVYEEQMGLRFSNGRIFGTFTNENKTFQTSGGSLDINTVKRAYSKEVVKFSAKRFGWNIKEKSPNRFVAQRRA